MVEGKTNKIVQHKKWTEGKDKGSIYLLKEGELRRKLQEIPESFVGHGWEKDQQTYAA